MTEALEQLGAALEHLAECNALKRLGPGAVLNLDQILTIAMLGVVEASVKVADVAAATGIIDTNMAFVHRNLRGTP